MHNICPAFVYESIAIRAMCYVWVARFSTRGDVAIFDMYFFLFKIAMDRGEGE
jgi:hypothetical protein